MTRFVLIALAASAFVLAGCQTTRHEATMDDTMDEMGVSSTEGESMQDEQSMMTTEFVVTISVLANSPTPLAPVAWAVHTGANPFVTGEMGRLAGLESLAEDGNPAEAAATLDGHDGVVLHGVANTPEGATSAGPATPGSSYSFTVKAHEGERLSFATMYVQSNDLFFSPGSDGIALFDMSTPVDGSITSRVYLYDAGTEVNEEPGSGPNQPPRQSGPNTGSSEDKRVTRIGDAMDGFTYPDTNAVISVTVSPDMM